MLRRALAQQAPVKQTLYRGVCAIADADASSVDVLLPLLYPHLQQCVSAEVGRYAHISHALFGHRHTMPLSERVIGVVVSHGCMDDCSALRS